MRRHDALIPLTHDHHAGLAHARRALKAARSGSAAWRFARAIELVEHFRTTTIPHLRAEEEVYFPLLSDPDRVAPRALIQALLEHVELRRMATLLATEVGAGAVTEQALADFAQLLERHIRLEERDLFPLLEQTQAEALDELASVPADPQEAGR